MGEGMGGAASGWGRGSVGPGGWGRGSGVWVGQGEGSVLTTMYYSSHRISTCPSIGQTH